MLRTGVSVAPSLGLPRAGVSSSGASGVPGARAVPLSVRGQDFHQKPCLGWSWNWAEFMEPFGGDGDSVFSTLRRRVLTLVSAKDCAFFKVYFQVLYLLRISS